MAGEEIAKITVSVENSTFTYAFEQMEASPETDAPLIQGAGLMPETPYDRAAYPSRPFQRIYPRGQPRPAASLGMSGLARVGSPVR
ncbi:hypothetical protein ACRAWD_15960 [Caulobacter segnis]